MSYPPEPLLDTFRLGATLSTLSPVMHPAHQSLGKWDFNLGMVIFKVTEL